MSELSFKLQEERDELGAKVESLRAFLTTADFLALAPEQRHLLRLQLSYMNGYHKTLTQRIKTMPD